MKSEIQIYNDSQTESDLKVCNFLAQFIDANVPEAESKIWHSHPVWFINGNPIVGYSKQKAGIRLMFWSGKSFEEEKLSVLGGKFQDASVFFNNVDEISSDDLNRWLLKSREIQWDYKNVVKRKGELLRLF